MTNSPFLPLLDGREEAHFIFRDDRTAAFLEKKPLKRGHIVVIPVEPVDFVFDLSEEQTSLLFRAARRAARALRKAVPCRKVAVGVLGLEVRHAHVHLVPVDAAAEFNFTLPRLTLDSREMHEIAQRIISELEPG